MEGKKRHLCCISRKEYAFSAARLQLIDPTFKEKQPLGRLHVVNRSAAVGAHSVCGCFDLPPPFRDYFYHLGGRDVGNSTRA